MSEYCANVSVDASANNPAHERRITVPLDGRQDAALSHAREEVDKHVLRVNAIVKTMLAGFDGGRDVVIRRIEDEVAEGPVDDLLVRYRV